MEGRIELLSLGKDYRSSDGRSVAAIRDASLSIPAGQICGLIGPNGAGKTTVLSVIAGLVPFGSGSIRLNGYDLAREREDALRGLGAVIEGHSHLQDSLSIEQNMMAIADGRQAEERARRLLGDGDLWERRDEPLGQLSQGLRKLVTLARALVIDPASLLLDEPLQYLDTQMARLAEDWIKQQAAEKGTTVLLATRQAAVVQALCDRVVVLRNGRIIADQQVDELPKSLPGEHYQIRIKSRLDAHRAAWFDELTLTTEGDQTVLSGMVPDQAALQGIIAKVRDLGIPLLSITHDTPDPEQALTHLMHSASGEPADIHSYLSSKEASL